MRQGSTLLVALGAALLAASAACTDPAKGEARSVLAAVERFRRAEFPGKPALLPELKAVACTDPEVCAAKDACVAHAEPVVQAIVMKTAVQVQMDAPDAAPMDAETRAALVAKLDEASRLLDKGRAAQAACDQKTLELMTKYRF